MELKDIISEGKIDREGMQKINELIEENSKLKNAFSYVEVVSPITGERWNYYYSKEISEKSVRLMPFIKEAVYFYIKNKRFVRTKALRKVLEEIK